MKIKYIIFINILSITLMACGGDKVVTDGQNTDETKQEEPKISAKTIVSFVYKDYALSSDAEKAIIDWDKYKELETQLSYLKKADLSFFKGDKESLKKFIDKLKLQIPSQIKTNPIISRLAIVETKLLKLNENLTIDNIPVKEQLKSIKELLVAFSNMNLQINKKLEFDIYNEIQPE